MGGNIGSFDVGTVVRLTDSIKTGGNLTDPATVSIRVQDPNGVITTYAFGSLTKDATGTYHVDIDTTGLPGVWKVRGWTAAGAGQGADDASFTVLDSTLK